MFYKLKFVLTKQQLLQIYYGLFHSVAVYGIIGWEGLYNNTFDPLDRLQQRILKTKGISETDPNRPLNIRQVFIMQALLYQYDELRAEYAQNPINTRYKSIKLICQPLTIGQRCYTYYVKKYFNKLPNNIKNLDSKSLLKKKIKEIIREITIE